MSRRIILPDWVKKQSEDILVMKKRIGELELEMNKRPITPAITIAPALRADNVLQSVQPPQLPPAILGTHRKKVPGEHARKSIHMPTMSFESKIVEIIPNPVRDSTHAPFHGVIESKSKVLNSQGLVTSLDKL